jgi:hypothetical protein
VFGARFDGSCLSSQLLGRQRLGGSLFEASPGEKLMRPHLNKQEEMVVHTCNLSYMVGIGRRITVPGYLGKNTRPYLQNN